MNKAKMENFMVITHEQGGSNIFSKFG
jgi:hypothetical protein